MPFRPAVSLLPPTNLTLRLEAGWDPHGPGFRAVTHSRNAGLERFV